MSLVRVGLSENRKFASGYDAIFAKPKVKKRTPRKVRKKARRK